MIQSPWRTSERQTGEFRSLRRVDWTGPPRRKEAQLLSDVFVLQRTLCPDKGSEDGDRPEDSEGVGTECGHDNHSRAVRGVHISEPFPHRCLV